MRYFQTMTIAEGRKLPFYRRPVALLVVLAAGSLILAMMIPRHPCMGHETIFSRSSQ